MEKTRITVVTDAEGFVKEFKAEKAEWNPTYNLHAGLSKSARAVLSLKVGDILRIVHSDLECNLGAGSKTGPKQYRHCNLQPVIYKQRKAGWELEYYHERPHVAVVRRLK